MLRRDSRSEPESPPSGMSGRILSTVNTVPITRKKGRAGPAHDGAALNSLCSGEPPARRRRRTSAREPKRYKPRPTGPHWTNQTHPYRAQNATARTQQHGSELWSPVRDEEAAGSNPVTPTAFPQVRGPHQKWCGPLRCQYSSKTLQVQEQHMCSSGTCLTFRFRQVPDSPRTRFRLLRDTVPVPA